MHVGERVGVGKGLEEGRAWKDLFFFRVRQGEEAGLDFIE